MARKVEWTSESHRSVEKEAKKDESHRYRSRNKESNWQKQLLRASVFAHMFRLFKTKRYSFLVCLKICYELCLKDSTKHSSCSNQMTVISMFYYA